ncbi:beta strand repeat-containing protein [Planctobacterium marinum]|uniref:Invasin n=1 Tax=Planctobacterium marinum TaxID=1631968 RepID=A0AA48HJP5_9ALTE|nr:hypothetical protein MACH26_36290 [Planctobacterium marinum]
MRANIFAVFLIFLISGCGGGSSGANGPDPFNPTPDPVIDLSIAILDSNCEAVSDNTFTTDEDICVQATLTSDGSAYSGQAVGFSLDSTIANLSTTSTLTGADGIAQIIISSNGVDTGAATVTATYESNTASESFEFVAGSSGAVIALEVSVLDGSCAAVDIPTFSTSENICVRALLTSDDNPVSGEIIRFSQGAAIGTLNSTTALTNANGIAETTISNSTLATGATTVVATFDTISSSANYEYVADAQSSIQISITVLEQDCITESQSFGTNEEICVRASLTRGEEGVSNEIVNFSLSSDLGTLDRITALTDAQGNAEVFITNSDATIGAAAVTASYDSLSSSQNYEYVTVNTTVTASPTVTVALLRDGAPVSAFQAGDSIKVQATVQDSDGNAVVGGIVTFSIQGTGPILTPTSELTGMGGVAEVDISATENDLGAYSLQVETTVNDIQISAASNFAVRSAGATVEGEIRFGHIDGDGNFVEGIIGSSIADENGDVTISAGATTGFDVALVDENDARITTPTPITFTSTCVANGQATIDETVTTINGVASATFEDLSCAGATGNSDQIVASVVINNETLTITRDLTIEAEGIGSISFVSATPDAIVLSGTGGQNSSSVSTLVFQVNGDLGNPLAQQEVSFSLNTQAGGLTLDPESGLTNSAGQVSTRVTAGTVPTPVRVTAAVTTSDNNVIRTQSDLLTVNTGLPDQNSFTLSADTLNPEAFDISGQTVTITARLADIYNNPVPNGTTVNFTTEYGSIEGSCETGEDADGVIDPTLAATGTCSVTWTSQNPRDDDDHRSTILATAIGHETLFDANGNNAYDDTDGSAITDGTDSGFGVSPYGQTGFVDYSEAWVDYNEDGNRDNAEPFVDFNGDETFNGPDGFFNGPQCNSDTGCSDAARSIHIRRALTLVLSSSDAYYRIYASANFVDDNIIATNDPGVTISNTDVVDGIYQQPDDTSVDYYIAYYDTDEQVLARGTQLGTINSDGDLSTVIDEVGNTTRAEVAGVPGSVFLLIQGYTNEAGSSDTSTGETFSRIIESPSNTRTNVNFSIARAAP